MKIKFDFDMAEAKTERVLFGPVKDGMVWQFKKGKMEAAVNFEKLKYRFDKFKKGHQVPSWPYSI